VNTAGRSGDVTTRVLTMCVLSLMAVVPAFAQKKGCEELALRIDR
jgi:hypothetical protein